MPFPIAHPAAVLPLRRFCPQRLNFPALVIGSVVPDLGYLGEQYHLADFSHRFIAGAFGFDLPVGFLLWLLFYAFRRRLINLLPGRFPDLFFPLCRPPTGFPWMIILSLLIGIWTHLSLDSITHPDGWVVEHVAFLRFLLPWPVTGGCYVFEFLYGACTFGGTAWLALAYLGWLEREHDALKFRLAAKWTWATLLGLGMLGIAEAIHRWQSRLGLIWVAVLTFVLLFVFWLATALATRKAPA